MSGHDTTTGRRSRGVRNASRSMRTRRSPQAITFARLSAQVPVSESSTCVFAATTFFFRYPSRPGNMMHLSDPDAAARHGPADKVFDGLGMLAGIIGANTINVRGCGVEPQPARPPAETSNVKPETRKRGSYTASPLPWRLPPSRCPELKKRTVLKRHYGKIGHCRRRIGQLSSEPRQHLAKDRLTSAGTALER